LAFASGACEWGLPDTAAKVYKTAAARKEPATDVDGLREVNDGAVYGALLTDGVGFWSTRQQAIESAVDPKTKARLDALGYLDGVEAAPARSGVVRHDAERAFPGLNLYTSGHAPEVNLVDMEGELLHRWSFDIAPLFADRPKKLRLPGRWFIRGAHVFPNGDLLALFEQLALVRLDRDSNLLWAFQKTPHHAFEVDGAGDIHVLATRSRIVSEIEPGRHLWDDQVVLLDAATGAEKDRFSILDGLLKGQQTELVDEIVANLGSFSSQIGDVLHTNQLEIVDARLARRLPDQEPGSYLLSSRRTDALMTLNPRTGKVDWVLRGSFLGQHHPTVLEDGRILMFDNKRDPKVGSRLIEILPESGEVLWEFGQTEDEPFFSACCGTVYRLPNGNTLTSETGAGRALEITPEGEVVWEFINPHRAGPDDQLIAQLFDTVRLPADFPLDWAAKKPDRPASAVADSADTSAAALR
jgi:hypothetical protein